MMERREFFSLLGLGSAAIAVGSCLGGCSKSSSSPTPANVDFTLDLTASTNAALLTNGGFIYSSGIIVARTLAGKFIAVSQACTHESVTVVYQGANNRFFCNAHGSAFSETGAVNNGPASSALKAYNTTVSGNSLRVFS